MKISVNEAQKPDGSKGYLVHVGNAGEISGEFICRSLEDVKKVIEKAFAAWKADQQ